MADVQELEAKFRSLPKGTPESNKAFREWREAANSEPPAEEPVESKPKARRKAR